MAGATPDFEVPHPRLYERWFALAPLLDVAPELEPVYGPALRDQGGRGLRYAEQLAPELYRRSGARCERARSGRRDCGCARAAWPQLGAADACATSAAQVVLLEANGGGAAGLAALVRAALDQALRGFAWTHARASALDPARASARLFGASAPRGANVPALLDAELTRDGDAHCARIRLAG